MIPREVLQDIRRIQIVTSRMVSDSFAGHYHSVFKGKGMEFEEVRQYLPGDDIRSIDWNVTARTGEPFIKKFREERELTIMLMLDMSRSSLFSSVNKLKSRMGAEICSLLAFSAITNNDRVGLIAFTDRIEIFIPPRKGVRHVLRIIREALYYRPEGKGTDIAGALRHLRRVIRRKAVTFVLSDFYDTDYTMPLAIAGKRHDIIAVTITDPRELKLPNVGIVRLEDAETGQAASLDTSSADLRREYSHNASSLMQTRKTNIRSCNIDQVDIMTDKPYAESLYRFFKTRQRRLR